MKTGNRRTIWTTLAACATLTGGCFDEGELEAELENGELAEADHAIEIGTNDASTAVRNAVVLIGGFCTGTLVAPDVVVTAGHCGFDDPAFADGNWHAMSPVTIFFGPDRAASVATATANQVSAPPLHTLGSWPDDIVLLRLTAPVPATTAVPRPMFVDRPATLSAASTIFQVGYGGGRNRRFMTGSSYRDWLTVGLDYLMNGFAYTATFAGTGIGDRGTNIEGGDSGGPMLLGSSTSFVMGVLSHWEPYGIATFGPGGEGRPVLRTWLQGKVPQKPDFDVVSVSVAGCTGTAGQPVVSVRLRNAGSRTSSAWVDVFHGRAAAPAIGELSTIFRSSGSVAPLATIDMSFPLPLPPGPRRIDVLLDTTRSVAELDESNNHGMATLTLPDCSFN